MIEKLVSIIERFDTVANLLNDPDLANDQKRFREFSKEYRSLEPVANAAERYLKLQKDLADNQDLIKTPGLDPEMKDLAYEEQRELQTAIEQMDEELRYLLIPKDPNDSKDCIVEIRAGTGGDEAAIFAGDLFRMYQRFCERSGFTIDVVDFTESERGGFKEMIFSLSGDDAFGIMKYESGVHRVQRVPDTEASGRIHTSAATVAVLPEAEEVDVNINEGDLRIDIFRSGGKGGQNVNKVETAVRMVHLPSGIVVQCQDERSQLQNRLKAMKILRARLLDLETQKQQSEMAAARKNLVKSGDRSDKIRTYNFPQNRVTDHRLEGDSKNYALREVIEGDLLPIIEQLRMAERAELLKEGVAG